MSKQKPDLMSARRDADGSRRILANLENGGKAATGGQRSAHWRIDGWTVGLCILLLAMAAFAWLAHERTITPETFKRDVRSESAPFVPSVKPIPSRSAQETAAAMGTTADTATSAAISTAENTAISTVALQAEAGKGQQAAAIVNEPLAERGPTKSTALRTAPHNVPTAKTNAAAATSALTAAAHSTAPHMTTSTAPISHKAPAAPAVQASVARNRTSASDGAARTGAASADTDVVLLTALVAHAGKPSSVAPERSRDVVERQDNTSTESLLARCKQLGLIESMLCRSRICSGRWENDAACRAPGR
jgi:hypothetical protein